MTSIAAECRICKNTAAADSFKLSHEYKMMVCPNCFSGRTKELQKKQEEQKKETVKPPGWDAEDEYLAKAAKLKQMEQKQMFKKIPGTHQVMCSCQGCKFEFKYDPFRKMPRSCPYCNADIPRLRTYGLL